MKIAITSTGDDLDSQVDPRFGRAKTFIIYDTESGDFEAVDNAQNLNAVQGAGIQAAETIVRHGAECVITGQCGPKAFRALQAAHVKIHLCSNVSVTKAIERFKSDELENANAATVEGHWM